MTLPCDICFEHFNLKNNRPKSLPCGHTFCLQCLQNPTLERKCATCRKSFTTGPADLPDTIFAIRMMETRNLKPASPVEVKELQRGVAAGEQVVQLLQQMVPLAVGALNAQLDSSRAQLQQMQRAVEAVQQGEQPRAVTATQLQVAKQIEVSHRLLTASILALHVEDEDGATRRISLPPDHLARLLLLEQRDHGEEKVEEVEDEAACCPLGPPSFSKDTPLLKADVSYKDQEELRLESYTVSNAARVRDLASLKRLSSVCVNPMRLGQSAIAYSWPDLPLHLEELHIKYPHADHLRCLKRMPRLRSLAVEYYYGDALTLDPVKPCGRCGVKWLGVKMQADQYPTLLSLVRAHAASLRTLEIKCGLQDFPALSQDLPASGLRFLRCLVLVRQHGPGDTSACDRQRLDIQNGLPKVVVMCTMCTAANLSKW